MATREALEGLNTHDLLVLAIREREHTFNLTGEIDADNLADFIEEIVERYAEILNARNR